MLATQLQIDFRDPLGVGHVVVDGRAGETMRARAVFLRPAYRRVDRDVGNVDSFRPPPTISATSCITGLAAFD